jgi:hypothetical protein
MLNSATVTSSSGGSLWGTRHMEDHRIAVAAVLGTVTRGPESSHQPRRQGAPAVDPDNKVGVFPGHHWTSAVSMVEPGPIVISTP